MSIKCVAISDSHSHDLRSILDGYYGGLLIIAGDWSYTASWKEITDFKLQLAEVSTNFESCCVIGGNHELGMEGNPHLEQEIMDATGCVYLNDSGVTVNIRGEEVKIWGSPVTPYFGGWAYNRQRGAEIRRHWELIPEGMDIVVTHGPIHRTGMDYLPWDDKYVGCEDLREVLVSMENSPKYHISGHIHLTAGKTFMLRTNYDKVINCMNVSVCNEDYDPVHPPTVFYI